MGNSTIKSIIEAGKQMRMTAKDLHYKEVVINSKGEKIVVMMNAIFERHYDLMLDHAVKVELSEADYHKYRFKPKVLSTDLYGTPELWFLLVRLNHMTSIIQFNTRELTVFEPRIVKILNEIMIHENDNIVDNDVSIIKKLNE